MDSMGVEDAPRVHVISDARLSAFSGRSRALERSASRDEGGQVAAARITQTIRVLQKISPPFGKRQSD